MAADEHDMPIADVDSELRDRLPTTTSLDIHLTVGDDATNADGSNGRSNAAIDLNAITARNAAESPLLSLPAELRLRIWEYAVGGHTFGFHESEFDRLHLAAIPHDQGWDCKLYLAQSCHRQAVTSTFARGLASGVCRQIRAEALNLQFALNIFHLDVYTDLENLISLLSTTQLGAIREISMHPDYTIDFVNDRDFGVDLPPLTALRGIKRIFFSGRLSTYGFGNENTSEFLYVMGIEQEAHRVEVVCMDALDRSKNIHDAKVCTL